MSFFAELKRRNVVRVGIAYRRGWLAVDCRWPMSFSRPSAHQPWVMQTLLAILAIGLPVALFLAWAFELTPEGVKLEKDVDRSQSITPQTGKKLNNTILVLMALAIGYLLFDKFSDPVQPGSESSSQQTASETTETGEKRAPTPIEAQPEEKPAISKRSIAVLPFSNRSRNADDEFFVEGVHDDLLTNLARIGSLKVISRTSMMRYKDTEISIPEIARELGVATIMEGAVQRSGNTVRINVQLIDAETDEHLWAEIFDRQLTAENLFAIQSEISEKIAAALQSTLSPREQKAINEKPTENLTAYNAYLLGRQLMARRGVEDLKRAQEEFLRATQLDPGFALAWVGIAETTLLLGANTRSSPTESMIRIEEAANKALEINDQLGEAYLSLATVDEFYERYDQAEANYRKAIELSPGYATAYQWYSDYVDNYPHRRREALAILRKGEELDPASSIIQKEIADQLTLLGQFDAAEDQLKRLIEIDPDFAPAYGEMADLMFIIGRFDEQVMWIRKAIELDPDNFGLFIALSFALLDLGDEEALADVQEHLSELDPQHWAAGWVETLASMYQENYAAALETANWVDKKLGSIPQFQDVFGYVYLLNKDYQKARQAFAIANPNFFDRANWRSAIELSPGEGCVIAYVYSRSGEETLGADLLAMTLSYMENELPNYVNHADRYAYDICYMVTGDYDKAMDAMETSFEHGHHSQWWILSNLSVFDPIRDTDRFRNLMQRIEDDATTRRANLARMTAEVDA